MCNYYNEKIFKVIPVAKPRMTQSDKWKKRKYIQEYWHYKDEIKRQCKNFKMPEANYHLIFYLPMPKSWSKKKRLIMNLTPHKVKPDKDNLEKAFLDSLCINDAYIWDGRVTKYWAIEGQIRIVFL